MKRGAPARPTMSTDEHANPLVGAWTPPHAAIRPEHFRPAFDRAMADHMVEIGAIATCPDNPSFANTIVALELSGRAFDRVSSVFHALAGAHTNDALMAIERKMSPLLAAHRNRIHLHDRLYARIKALWETRGTPGLTPEEGRGLEGADGSVPRPPAARAAPTKNPD